MSDRSDNDSPVPEDEYIVENIRDIRWNKDLGRIEYLLKWKDFLDTDNTWEPEENAEHCPDLLKLFAERRSKLLADHSTSKTNEALRKKEKKRKRKDEKKELKKARRDTSSSGSDLEPEEPAPVSMPKKTSMSPRKERKKLKKIEKLGLNLSESSSDDDIVEEPSTPRKPGPKSKTGSAAKPGPKSKKPSVKLLQPNSAPSKLQIPLSETRKRTTVEQVPTSSDESEKGSNKEVPKSAGSSPSKRPGPKSKTLTQEKSAEDSIVPQANDEELVWGEGEEDMDTSRAPANTSESAQKSRPGPKSKSDKKVRPGPKSTKTVEEVSVKKDAGSIIPDVILPEKGDKIPPLVIKKTTGPKSKTAKVSSPIQSNDESYFSASSEQASKLEEVPTEPPLSAKGKSGPKSKTRLPEPKEKSDATVEESPKPPKAGPASKKRKLEVDMTDSDKGSVTSSTNKLKVDKKDDLTKEEVVPKPTRAGPKSKTKDVPVVKPPPEVDNESSKSIPKSKDEKTSAVKDADKPSKSQKSEPQSSKVITNGVVKPDSVVVDEESDNEMFNIIKELKRDYVQTKGSSDTLSNGKEKKSDRKMDLSFKPISEKELTKTDFKFDRAEPWHPDKILGMTFANDEVHFYVSYLERRKKDSELVPSSILKKRFPSLLKSFMSRTPKKMLVINESSSEDSEEERAKKKKKKSKKKKKKSSSSSSDSD